MTIPTEQRCVVCRKPIEEESKKCTECDSYQDWSRYIFRYASVATAALGIVPIVTIAASLYEIAFGTRDAEIRAALIACNSNHLEIGITNVGDVPAFISNVEFRSPDTPSVSNGFNIRRTDSENAYTFSVDPKEGAKIVSYRPFIGDTPARFPKFPENTSNCRYQITVETLQFNQEKSMQELECDCSRY